MSPAYLAGLQAPFFWCLFFFYSYYIIIVIEITILLIGGFVMAVFNSYSVFDIKSVTFGLPFFSVNEATAIRDFGDLASDPSTTVCRHKEDFRLYLLGTFDSGTGRFSPCDIPIFICDALRFSDSPSSDSRVSDFTFGDFRDDED